MTDVSSAASPSQSEHKSVTSRGGHRIEVSRNIWEGSGLKVDSSSTDVAWCHGAFSNKILTSARNGELIMWDLNKSGPSKFERRVRDHARSIHALQYSPILQSYCITGSADGDIRIWDIRDLTKSIMRIHHPAAVRAVAFSPVSSHSRNVVAALENGSIYRWDLSMGQRGQLDRIPVAHAGPVLSLDWVPPITIAPPVVSTPRGPNWYATGTGFFDDILPSVPIAAATTPPSETETAGSGWIVSGGMDRCVKVWDLAHPATKHKSLSPTYTLQTSFPVRRVLWRPGYDCELAIVSNAGFGSGADFGHGALSGGSTSGSGGLGTPSPRIGPAHLSDSAATPETRSTSVPPSDGSDPVEIWDVRRGYIAKWVVTGSAIEGGVTDIEFADSHALWTLHSSGAFSQLDLRQCRKPLDAIPRTAISWNTTGSIAFVTDKPKRWELPYDDVDAESKHEKAMKALGDSSFQPTTQSVGAFVHDGAMEDLEMIEKLARGYIYTDKERPQICAHNSKVAMEAGAFDAAQTWLLLESLLTEIVTPPTPPLSPVISHNPLLAHSTSAPAAIPTINSLQQPPSYPQRSFTTDVPVKTKDSSPSSRSKYSDDRQQRSSSRHRSPHGLTPTSSNASSPRKSSTGLPSVPASIFARRDSGAGLPPPMRPRLPSSFRRPSFSTQSTHSIHSETPSDSLRSQAAHASLRHVGEGALDDSDSSESGSDPDGEDHTGDGEQGDSHTPSSTSSSRGPNSPFFHRTTTAHPSPLSRPSVTGQQTWTEDEKDDDDSPSPASTSAGSSEEMESDDDRSRQTGRSSRRPSAVRMMRRSSTRSKTRSRSSTVASLVAPSPHALRRIVKQESQSSIRTVIATPGESTPGGGGPPGLRRDDTIRDLSGGRAASVRASSSSLHQRAKSEALSSEFMLDADGGEGLPSGSQHTPMSASRTPSDRTRVAIRDMESRLKDLAWETMRDRFELYSDEGDVIMCAMLALVVPKELKIEKSRIARLVESYIEILSRLRLHTCAAYIRKFVSVESIRVTTSMSTTIYSSCGKCRKPIVLPAGPMVHAGKPSGSYGFCTTCQASITKCSICHLPVRSLMFQCPVCMHGGHQDCYREYYTHRPPDEITPPPHLPMPMPSIRPGRSAEINLNPPRGRALSRTNSTYTVDVESDDGASAHGDGEGTTGSYHSARGLAVTSSNMILGQLCAAGCGHHCWAAHDKS